MVRTHWKGNADMTPINSTAPGGLPEYARQDVVDSGAGYAPVDPAYAQSIDPSQPGFVDPSAYANAATPDSYGVDPYAAPYEAQPPESAYGSAVSGLQPATTATAPAAMPDATLEDFARLGIFTDDELAQLAQMNMPAQDMNALFDEAVAFMQTPGFAQLQAQQAGAAGEVPVDGRPAGGTAPAPNAADVANGVAAPSGPPAWNGEWAVKFRDVMEQQGLDSKTQLMVIASLRQAPLGEAELQQALEYYSSTPEGKAELQEANDQVKAGAAMQDKMMLTFGAGALGVAGVAGAIGASRGNLVKALEHTVASGGERAATAARALEEIKAGKPITTAMRAEIASTLRAEAKATSRLRSPISKMSLNGAARNVTPAAKLSFRDAMKYGLWMKSGDAVTDAASGASTAARSTATAVKAGELGSKVASATGAGDDVVRAVAGSADEAGKVASGAAQAAKGASMLGKVGKVLGPVGLALSAGVGIWGISKTVEAEGGFGKESAKMTGNVAGGLAGGVAGAAAGAAIGSVVPVIGTGIGAVVGGIVGSIGLSKVGEGVGGFIHGLFD
ncbi:MAG: hypothetical protein JWL76_2253 [Thermoleophilia bacterium]|nr:hypothetical protein [Thermoleophilia bacterium]